MNNTFDEWLKLILLLSFVAVCIWVMLLPDGCKHRLRGNVGGKYASFCLDSSGLLLDKEIK